MALTFLRKKKKKNLTYYGFPVNNPMDKEDSFVSWPTFSGKKKKIKGTTGPIGSYRVYVSSAALKVNSKV